MITCCGKTFPAGFRARHEAGLLHRSRRIRDLLNNPCISQREIARRVGCSAQMISLIARSLNTTPGVERMHICSINRQRQSVLNSVLISAFRTVANANALPWDLLVSDKGCFLKSRIQVNGYTVDLRKTRYRSNGYLGLHPTKSSQADFVAYLLQEENEWLVFPRCARPLSQTMFALEPNLDGLGFTRDRRHDWPIYRNAWHLLTKVKAA